MKKNENVALLIIRLLVGVLIIFHGFGNLLSGYEFITGVLSNAGLPGVFAYGAFFGEIVAPILIIIGYRLRIASLVLAFTMFVAIALAHTGDLFSLNQFGGWALELQGFYLFGAIALFYSGAGTYAVSTTNNWD